MRQVVAAAGGEALGRDPLQGTGLPTPDTLTVKGHCEGSWFLKLVEETKKARKGVKS